MSALATLHDHHRKHYDQGTLESFSSWFGRSGYGDMLTNPFIEGGGGPWRGIELDRLSFAGLSGVRFENLSGSNGTVAFRPTVGQAGSLEELFAKFVRVTGHTHPIADFREHLGYFTPILAGSRFVAFHGAGSCLLLGSIFQALAARLLDEPIDLFYSHAAHKEFTHVYGTWRDRVFVDPDQKTWAPVAAIDDVPSLGYIFQQFGVAGQHIYDSFGAAERQSLFAKMTRDYFTFYGQSVRQYMYETRHDVGELARLFREARTKFRSPFSVDASDYPWKDELRRQAELHGVPRPYFLLRADEPVVVPVPEGGSLRIGVGADALPQEVSLLAAIFFGRVPASIRLPMNDRTSGELWLPEFPWMLVFESHPGAIQVNGRAVAVRSSRCGRYWIVGMGELEHVLSACNGPNGCSLRIDTHSDEEARVVLPFNAFALAADLLECHVPAAAGWCVEGRSAV